MERKIIMIDYSSWLRGACTIVKCRAISHTSWTASAFTDVLKFLQESLRVNYIFLLRFMEQKSLIYFCRIIRVAVPLSSWLRLFHRERVVRPH